MHKIMHTFVKTTLTHNGFVKYLLLEQYDLQVPLEQVMKKVVCRQVILHSPLLLWGCADVSSSEDQNCLLHNVHKYSIESDLDVGFFELVVTVRSQACSTNSNGKTN